MRPDRLLMEMADRDAEPLPHRSGQRLRSVQLCRVEIDMGVKVADRRFGHGGSFATPAGP